MISFKNINFSYGNENINNLCDINLKIKKGECVLVCGRSGCGKTTLTRLLNGLIPNFYEGKLSGSVKIGDMNISETKMFDISAKVGSVFQNPRTQFFNVDTDSEVAFGIENQAMPIEQLEQRVKYTMRVLDIKNLSRRNIFELSGGEKQKIAFASVFAMDPDVYLLDEPSSNLDMDSIYKLKAHIKLIKNSGKTLIISEHRIHYLMDIVDKIIYLEKGKIKNIYSPDEFMQINEKERISMGLRCLDLNNIKLTKSNKEREQSHLEKLSIENISVSYKKRQVLKNINLKVYEAEVIAIVGYNGAGKTTLSRTLCGLQDINQGKIKWEGKDINNKQNLELSYMVMQDVNYQLFAESVENECSFGIKDADKEVVKDILEELDLWEYKQRHPNTLSGGQKQRLAVATSMVCKKEILIFDEPTSGLDYDSMQKVSNIINKLSKMNKVIFIVTHDYEFATNVCTRAINIKNGSINVDIPIDVEHEEDLKKLFFIESEIGGI